jgi:hypothetical protein
MNSLKDYIVNINFEALYSIYARSSSTFLLMIIIFIIYFTILVSGIIQKFLSIIIEKNLKYLIII